LSLRAVTTDERPTTGRIDDPAALAIGPDGKILVAGRYAPNPEPPRNTPQWDLWHTANDITVVRSIEIDKILPEPAPVSLLLVALALLTHRRH
jgi:hypothetical protein